MIRAFVASLCLALAGCGLLPEPVNKQADMLVVGDSILAWNRGTNKAIPDVIAEKAGIRVNNVAISGARFMGFAAIPTQYVANDWQYVLMDGGGNDLLATCGTDNDAAVIDALISADVQRGAYVEFADRVAADGATLLILGYYPISVNGGPFTPCRDALDDLATRQALFADSRADVIFVDTSEVISPDNLDAYDDDLIHPTPLGSALIGAQVASLLAR